MIGCLITLTMIYRLLFVERLPYNIDASIPWTLVAIVLSLLFMQVLTLKTNIGQLRNMRPSVFAEMLIKISEYLIYKHLRAFSAYLLKKAIISKITLESGGSLLYSLPNTRAVFLVNLPLLLMPKLILACVLLADVVLLDKVYAFYHVIWVGGITLLFQGELSMIWHHVSRQKAILEENYINVELRENNVRITSKANSEKFEEYSSKWLLYNSIIDAAEACYLCVKTRLYLISSIIITSIFIISWSMYIIKVLIAKFVVSLKFSNFLTCLLQQLIFGI